MQRRIRIKNLHQHLGGNIGLDHYSSAGIFIKVIKPFQDNKCPMLAGREARGCTDHSLNGLLDLFAGTFVGYPEKSAGTANPLKGATKFRGKDNWNCKNHGRQDCSNEPRESR